MRGFFKRTDNKSLNFFKALLIVLIFSAAHFLFCYLLHDTRFGDELVLTILTVAMIFCVIRFYGSPFDVFLGLAFLGCFAGFFIGTTGAKYIADIIPSRGVLPNMITTFLTTFIIGLVIILVVRKKKD